MRSIRLLLAPLAVASLAASCGGHSSPSVPASAIAVVGDRTISRSQFAALMAQARQSYASQGRTFPARGTSDYKHLRELAVSVLVEQAELEQEAPKLGVEVGEEQVEAKLRQLKEQSFGGSELRYRARLRSAGMTDAQIRSALKAQLLAESVRLAVTADVTVDVEDVQKYYETHLAGYTAPRSRVVRHILVKTRAAALRVTSRLHGGASFAELARRWSADASTRAGGGRLTLVEGRTRPGLDRVGFALRSGRVSRPFHTSLGWELVQALSAIRPARTTPLATVRDGIRRQLLGQRRGLAFTRWLDQVRAKYASQSAFASGYALTDK